MNSAPRPQGPVIVGVAPGQPRRVVEQAADFALRFGTELVCAYVDQSRVPLPGESGGTGRSAPIDPDPANGVVDVFAAGLDAELRQALGGSGVTWRTVTLAGEVAAALGHHAERIDAAMIVVGTHRHSAGGSLQEFFNRSVATHLSHRQARPVVVIPARQED
ncbi:universal stress protein [Paeniglutamicibacter sp. R2-26]|uniref:universal stress protein n=1 Tax=Paeniglutamicibacter sp. R2-26 TaxID=3144417 RepID=UPI003EE52E7C